MAGDSHDRPPLYFFDKDEWYPVRRPVLSGEGLLGSYGVEVPAETLARWEAATKAFEEAQDEMAEYDRRFERRPPPGEGRR